MYIRFFNDDIAAFLLCLSFVAACAPIQTNIRNETLFAEPHEETNIERVTLKHDCSVVGSDTLRCVFYNEKSCRIDSGNMVTQDRITERTTSKPGIIILEYGLGAVGIGLGSAMLASPSSFTSSSDDPNATPEEETTEEEAIALGATLIVTGIAGVVMGIVNTARLKDSRQEMPPEFESERVYYESCGRQPLASTPVELISSKFAVDSKRFLTDLKGVIEISMDTLTRTFCPDDDATQYQMMITGTSIDITSIFHPFCETRNREYAQQIIWNQQREIAQSQRLRLDEIKALIGEHRYLEAVSGLDTIKEPTEENQTYFKALASAVSLPAFKQLWQMARKGEVDDAALWLDDLKTMSFVSLDDPEIIKIRSKLEKVIEAHEKKMEQERLREERGDYFDQRFKAATPIIFDNKNAFSRFYYELRAWYEETDNEFENRRRKKEANKHLKEMKRNWYSIEVDGGVRDYDFKRMSFEVGIPWYISTPSSDTFITFKNVPAHQGEYSLGQEWLVVNGDNHPDIVFEKKMPNKSAAESWKTSLDGVYVRAVCRLGNTWDIGYIYGGIDGFALTGCTFRFYEKGTNNVIGTKIN